MRFVVYGHPLITCKHKTTLEFTKEHFVTVKGDCIAGINAQFDKKKIVDFCQGKSLITVTIKVDNILWSLQGRFNPNFNDDHEIVMRKSDFVSPRTLLIQCDQAASDMPYGLVTALQDTQTKAIIILS